MGRVGIQQGGIRTVQALRGLACLLVVAYHAVDAWGAGRTPQRVADMLWANGAAGVDIFFVVSGFVMALSSAGLSGPAGARRFVRRRVLRVVPLYWLMTTAKLALLQAMPGHAFGGPWHLVASFLFVPSRDAAGVVRPVLGVGWTLQFEMFFYALFALALVLRRPVLRVVLPVLVPLTLAGFARRADWPAPLALANGLVLEFCLGLAVASWCRRGRPGPLVSALLLDLGLTLLLGLPQPGPWRCVAWGVPAAMMLAGAVGLEPALGGRLPKPVLAVGDASYAIYLLHPFLLPVLARSWAGHTLPGLLVLGLALSVIGGMALHRWVDRPLQRWLAGPGRRAALPAASPGVSFAAR